MRQSDERRLYHAIHQSMRYWCCRLIMGLSAEEASAYIHGISRAARRAQRNASRLKAYHRGRASGLTHYEALAKVNGMTPEHVIRIAKRASRRLKKAWNGYPVFGTEAWKRREIARTEWAV